MPTPALPTSYIIVDNSDEDDYSENPANCLQTEIGGYNGDYRYMEITDFTGTPVPPPTCLAHWAITPPNGTTPNDDLYYDVYVHIPKTTAHTLTRGAVYSVWHHPNSTAPLTESQAIVVQAVFPNDDYEQNSSWVYIGRYFFTLDGTEYIELGNVTLDGDVAGYVVAADAIELSANTLPPVNPTTMRSAYLSQDAAGQYVAYAIMVEICTPFCSSTSYVYLLDTDTGLTELISEQAGYWSGTPRVSDNGRYIFYQGNISVFVYDRVDTVLRQLVSNCCSHYDISGDGRFVAFSSESSDFDPMDNNGISDVFLIDTTLWSPPVVSTSTPIPTPTATSTCVAGAVLSADSGPNAGEGYAAKPDDHFLGKIQQTTELLDLLYRLRDDVMSQTEQGQAYTMLYGTHTNELTNLVLADSVLFQQAYDTLTMFTPHFQDFLDGDGTNVVITAAEVQAVQDFLDNVIAVGSPDLQQTIAQERVNMPLENFIGLPVGDAWNLFNNSGNLLQNGDFEEGLVSWNAGTSSNVTISSDAYSGSNALEIGSNTNIYQPVLGLTEGWTYTFSGWAKRINGTQTANVGLNFIDANGNQLLLQNLPVTATETPTQPPGGGGTFLFTPIADAFVAAQQPTANQGTSTLLRTDSVPENLSYLKFDVQNLDGAVSSAKLRLFVLDTNTFGFNVHRVNDNSWAENTVSYSTRPTTGLFINASGAISASSWVEIDVTAYVTGEGVFSFVLTPTNDAVIRYRSRETNSAPELIVETGSGPNPTATPIPTFTPTSTATTTPGVSPTPTQTATPTPTSTATVTPTSTPTSQPGGSTAVFNPTADAFVSANQPTGNQGSNSLLRTDAIPDTRSYLKFNVQNLNGNIVNATLRIFTLDSVSSGFEVYTVPNNNWAENTITYNTIPATGAFVTSSGATTANSWIEIDTTSVISGNGEWSFVLIAVDDNLIRFRSRESSAAPELVVVTGSGSMNINRSTGKASTANAGKNLFE